MIESVFRSDDVPAAERFERWRERIGQSHAPAELSSDNPAGFRGNHRLVDLGATHVSTIDFTPMRVRRTPRLIRRSDPEWLHLTLTLRGGIDVALTNERVTVGQHDWYVHDTSRPYDFAVRKAADRDTFTAVEATIPRALLPLPANKIDRVMGRRVSGRDGLGALLADLVTRLATNGGHYHPADGPRLEPVLLDLVSAQFAHMLDAESRLPPETRRHALTQRIQAFIRQHLHDPRLTPAAIAAAHHISTSYLHRLFQDEDVTVAAWIRRQRLERARRELTDPALHAVPIHRIAARWGFTHPAAFTRAFRAGYGVPPAEHRSRALSCRAR